MKGCYHLKTEKHDTVPEWWLYCKRWPANKREWYIMTASTSASWTRLQPTPGPSMLQRTPPRKHKIKHMESPQQIV